MALRGNNYTCVNHGVSGHNASSSSGDCGCCDMTWACLYVTYPVLIILDVVVLWKHDLLWYWVSLAVSVFMCVLCVRCAWLTLSMQGALNFFVLVY